MPTLSKQQSIGSYTVAFPIKDSTYAETYRVKDTAGKNYFMKLFNYAKLHHTQFDENGDVLELVISQQLNHQNLTHYHDSGELVLNGQKMAYIVYDFISGETLAQKTGRERGCSVYDAKQYVLGVLEGVKFLHNLANPVIHNELTTENVMLDMKDNAPKIIDFGYARFLSQGRNSFQKEGLNPFYMAPEAFNGIFTVQSDLYSVGAMLYHLLFGMPPYYVSIPQYQADRNSVVDTILRERQKPLNMLIKDKPGLDDQLVNTLRKALANDVDERFRTADEFIRALNNEVMVEAIPSQNKYTPKMQRSERPKTGNGFADVAGMTELKEQLQSDVIDLLQNPKQAKALGLSIPNGLLFYGPPGCGKTFFAEKFAEETGFNYIYVKGSDVASPYIDGGKGKIADIFNQARENAPTILFLDEVDAIIRDRSEHNNAVTAGAVNQFLMELNNCGKDKVLVIGATNKPMDIDEAALRAGRLELKYYIPQPDKETRKEIFRISITKREYDFGIDYDRLADMTDNYISADISLVIDTAARLAFRRGIGKITMALLEEAIANTKPSLTMEQIRNYENIRDQFMGISTKKEKNVTMGFKPPKK